MIGNLWCENCTCGAVGKEKNFSLDLDEHKDEDKIPCPNDGISYLKLMGYKTAGAHIDKAKHAKGRTTAEKQKRTRDDFKKNTLPTLGLDEKRHFARKYGLEKKLGKK